MQKYSINTNGGKQRTPPTVNELRCEYQETPYIDTLKPRFSWGITSKNRGVLQDAYQILVASSQANLNANNGDMWDSGKVESGQSTHIPYAGKALTSGLRCYWKVRVWDQSGQVSAYGEPRLLWFTVFVNHRAKRAWWEMGLLKPEDWTGNWIEPEGGVPPVTRTYDEFKTTQLPDLSTIAPNLFRKQFVIKKRIKKARAYVTGAGAYLFYLNGELIGDSKLAPDFTDYDKRIQYQTFDVTKKLHDGENVIGAALGNGLRLRSHYPELGSRQLLLQLNITYTDGTTESIVTDKTWKCIIGPRLLDNIFWGEIYDARRELPGWNKPGFNDGNCRPFSSEKPRLSHPNNWQAVRIKPDPFKGKLVSHQCEPIKVTETIQPVKITHPEKRLTVFDMGQNIAGWVRLKVKGSAGTMVRLRFGEFLDDKGNVSFANTIGYGNIQTDIYVLKGEGTEVWEPQFIYHGFRYVEVSNYPGEPTLDSIEGRVVHSAVPWAGKFSCSNELINRIHQNATWSIRGNLHSIPTDCCQRAERSGWGGDAQVIADTAAYNFDMSRFYSKWLNDFKDDQKEDGAVHDNVPWTGWGGWGSPGWHDAYIKIAMVVYKYYGDTRVIEEQYEGMKRAIEYILASNENLIWEKNVGGDYADWGSPVNDEEHKALLATCNFYRAALFMSQMAGAIGNKDDESYYAELSENIKKTLNERFFKKDTGNYAGGAQAANAFVLFLEIVPKEYVAKVVENLVDDIKKQDYHLTTGPQGTRYVMQTLRMYGENEVAYKLATQTTMPSWGYMVEKGATTMWEFWNGDKGISHNHPFLGSVDEWFYRALAGINMEESATGFEKIIIKPHPVADVTWAKGSLKAMRGLIRSEWKKSADGLTLNVTIPANSTAKIYIPKAGRQSVTVTENGNIVWKDGAFKSGVAGITDGTEDADFIIVNVGSGVYSFELK